MRLLKSLLCLQLSKIVVRKTYLSLFEMLCCDLVEQMPNRFVLFKGKGCHPQSRAWPKQTCMSLQPVNNQKFVLFYIRDFEVRIIFSYSLLSTLEK